MIATIWQDFWDWARPWNWDVTEAVGTWAGAIGTILAIFATNRLSQNETNRLEKDRKQDKTEQDEAAKKAQANLISAWVEDSGKYSFPNPEHTNQMTLQSGREIRIMNGSQTPIFNVVVSLVGLKHDDLRSRRGEDLEGNEKLSQEFYPTVAPGLHRSFIRDFGATPTKGDLYPEYVTEIAFIDSNEMFWVRRGGGQLEPLPQSPRDFMGVDFSFRRLGLERIS